MGRRSAFVKPNKARLYLADARKRALEALQQLPVPVRKTEVETAVAKKALDDAIVAAKQAYENALEDGWYIDVKKELNAGETQRVFTDLVRGGGFEQGERPILDANKVGVTKSLVYILGWNLTGENDEPVDFSESALMNTNVDVFADIVASVDWHDEQAEKARADRKNGQGTSQESGATSSSPSELVGASTGSGS